MAVAFDEMNGPGGALRSAYHELSLWLKETPPDALEYRRQEAELLFRRIGITFAVYGEAESTERLIPFDVIPRILSGKEWTTMEKGLKQRVKALNMFLSDIYHSRLAAGSWSPRGNARRRGGDRSPCRARTSPSPRSAPSH